MFDKNRLSKKQANFVLDNLNLNYVNDSSDLMRIVHDKLSGNGLK